MGFDTVQRAESILLRDPFQVLELLYQIKLTSEAPADCRFRADVARRAR